MNQVFISYSRVNVNFARRLAADFDRDELDVWIDVEDIPPGTNWSNAINEGLNSADVMILIMSPASMSSKNVEDEWQYFHSRKMPLIPVLIEPCDNIHYQLARLQYINFIRQDYETAYDELLAQLRAAGLDAKRLSDRLAEYEAQRERKIEEKERLRRAIARLEQEQAEVDRLQKQYDALQAAQAEEDMLEEKIQQVQAEEAEYQKVVEEEKKRATADESQQIPLFDKTRPIPVTIRSDDSAPIPVDIPAQDAPVARRGLSLPVQGALITGVMLVLIFVGVLIVSTVLDGDDDGNGDNGNGDQSFGDTGDLPVVVDAIAFASLNGPPTDIEWEKNGDILTISTRSDSVPIFNESFEDVWQHTDGLGSNVTRVSWDDRAFAVLTEPSDDVLFSVWDIDSNTFIIDPIGVGTCETSVALDYYQDFLIIGCDSQIFVKSIVEDEALSYSLDNDVVQVMIFDADALLFGAVDVSGAFYFLDHDETQLVEEDLLPDDDLRYVSDWNPDDNVLIVSGPDSGKIWFVDSDGRSLELYDVLSPGIESAITAINYSPIGAYAIGYEDGQVEVRFLYDEYQVVFRPPSALPVTALAINSDGELAVGYGDDQALIVWDLYAEPSSDENGESMDSEDGSGDDNDDDGLSNSDESDYGSDPDNWDTDGDGLSDGEEVYETGTDPTLHDSDNDGVHDADDSYPLDDSVS
ncbi:MAG: TIR domain-containing protein [Chloroflexi bacterium]|nr:TIR domain-containing protein [Chloroflexota bacterium]